MLISRDALAAVLPATDRNGDTRYYLQAVQVEPSGRLAATNGHVLLTTQAGPMHDEDFPIVPGAPFHGSPAGPVLIPADVAAKLIKATPGKTSIPVLSYLQLSQNGSPETATLTATDLQTPTIATLKNDGQTFPQIDRVLQPTGGALIEVTLGVPVLEVLIKAAKAAKGKSITFQIPSDDKGRQIIRSKTTDEPTGELGPVIGSIPVSIKAGDGSEVSGVAMPMRR